MTLPFLYQLQNASYASLDQSSFRIAVIDQDDSQLSTAQVRELRADGKMLLAYTSIGEAEDYRNYWSDGKWNTSPPDFLLAENPNWEGNFLVEFWNADWQKIVMQRVDAAISLGYNGVYLDIVDAYTVSQVKRAYSGTSEQLRQEMIDFVVKISDYANAKKPGFLIIPQNAVGLLSADEHNPDGASNARYLSAIDGLGVEDLWFDGNSTSGWTSGDLQYIQHALAANKFVLATSYPTDTTKQAQFIKNAIDAGLIPFAADRDLTGKVSSTNTSIEKLMAGEDITLPWSATVQKPLPPQEPIVEEPVAEEPAPAPAPKPAPAPEQPTGSDGDSTDNGAAEPRIIIGNASANKLTGSRSDDVIWGRGGNDTISGGEGNDKIFGQFGHDKLLGGWGADSIHGGGGNDSINGHAGNDVIYGGMGRDFIRGGRGDDVLFGGKGADVFHFSRGMDKDVIRDFEDNVDTVVLKGFNFSDPFNFAEQKGANVVFDFGNGDVLTVENMTIAQMQDDLLIA